MEGESGQGTQLRVLQAGGQEIPDDLYKHEGWPPERILLAFPPLNNVVFFGVYEPLVMEIFSAIAKEEGREVELVDLRVDRRGLERLAKRGWNPDLIGLTTHGFPEVPIVNEWVGECKRLWPDAAVAIGGGQATVTPELFDQANIDIIVRGPGERIWRKLCRTGVARGCFRLWRILTRPAQALHLSTPGPAEYSEVSQAL